MDHPIKRGRHHQYKMSTWTLGEVLLLMGAIWLVFGLAVYLLVALTTGCWMIWPANQWFFCAVGF